MLSPLRIDRYLKLMRDIVRLKGLLNHHDVRPVVFCQQNLDFSHSASYPGKLMEQVAPLPGRPSAQMRPPYLSTMRWQIERPRPVPGNSSLLQALEKPKDFLWVLRVKSNAVILDGDDPVSNVALSRNDDLRCQFRLPIPD